VRPLRGTASASECVIREPQPGHVHGIAVRKAYKVPNFSALSVGTVT